MRGVVDALEARQVPNLVRDEETVIGSVIVN